MTTSLRYEQDDLAPSQVRRRIQEEHVDILRFLVEVEVLARGVLEGQSPRRELRRRMHELYVLFTRHIDLEDAILAPALRDTDSFGPVRADQLVAHHREQRALFGKVLEHAIEESDPQALAQAVLELVSYVRADIAHEERDLLHPDLLRDDPLNCDIFTG